MAEKILVVDEDEIYSSILREQLTGLNYQEKNILSYTSIQDAIIGAASDVSIILADFYSSKRDALQCLNALQECFPDVPIILLTTTAKVDTIPKLIAQGAQDYLVKEELDANALKKAIWLAINRKKQASANNSGSSKNKELADIIKRQKQQLDDILSSITDVVWSRRGDDFSLIYINSACIGVYGYTPEEMMSEYGKTLDHIHPDDKELLNEKISKTLKNGSGGMEYRVIHKDGSVKYLYGHSTVKYKDGKPEVINGVSVDITDIRNAEMALEEKILDIEDIFESITERFFSADKNWNITYVNKQFEKLYNISKNDIVGKNVFDAFPNIVNTHFHKDLQRSMEESVVTHSEGISPTSGRYISLDAYPTRNGIAVYIKDITEQRELHDQLLNEEQKLRAIINNTKDIIWYVDKDLNIISGNQAFYDRVAGMTNNKEYAELTDDDFKEEEVKKWNAFFTRGLGGERFKVIEENTVNGKKMYEEISFNPIPDKDNTIVGISCFSRDITEEKTLQDRILRDKQNLRALINNTRDFIWSVDKDLNVISVNEPFVDFISSFTNRVLKPGDPILFDDFGEKIRTTWVNAYAKALAGKRVIFEDETIIQGKSFYTEKSLNPIFDDKGEVVGVSCFAHDKSEEIKLRKQIQKDEQSLRATINNTRDHIWSVDNDLKIIFLNQSAKEFVFNVTGQTLGAGDFVLPEGFSEAFIETRTAHYRKALEGNAFSIVDELYDNDEISYMETSFNPIKDMKGNVIGVNCFSRDITAQKKHLAQIEQQNAKLKEIAWIQSHKVRGPVASILGLIALFNYDEAADPVNKEILSGIKTASTHLDEIIKEVVIMTENMGTDLQ